MKTQLSSLLLLVIALAGCSGSGNVMDDGGDENAIRVLMVTATHEFRHTSIETSRMVMAALADTSEFIIDMTEDINDFNTDKLARYDVLFFANSTLRAAADFPDSADSGMGDWRNYEVTATDASGENNAFIALSGSPGNLTGTIDMHNGTSPIPLQDVALNGDVLSFSFNMPDAGMLTAEATLDGEALSGTVSTPMGEMPFSGNQVASEASASDGEARVTAEQRAAIQAFLASGKGIAVAHAGLDAFYEWDWYKEMVGGGLFKEHPWTQEVQINIEETSNPSVAHFGESFTINDEIYVLDKNPRWNSRVIASLDMHSVDADPQGPADQAENDYPIAWVRKHDGGRVFVTKLGHFEAVWQNPGFVTHIAEGLRMAAGHSDAPMGGHRVKETIVDNVWPDDIAVDKKGNVWVVELRGKIHYWNAETGESHQVGEIPTTDPTGIEHGIYGVEVDPDFHNGSPYIYIFYAQQNTFLNILSRFEATDGQIDFDSEHVILTVPTEPQCCHQAGDLEWGPDGTLYVSTGDTGYSGTKPEWEISEERIEAFKEKHNLDDYHWTRLVDSEYTSQNMSDLRGKILRINKDGTIPKDNPFYGEPGKRWEVYAYGLRNPYRFKVDHQTGEVIIGVVGPDAVYDYDEYNISREGGENFGWPRTIGRLFYNEWTPDMIENYTPPIWEYTYEKGSRSATIGPIYRHNGENAFPEFLQNKVFLYDWSRRWIKYGEIGELVYENDKEGDVRVNPPDIQINTPRLINIKQFDQFVETTPISMELAPDGSLIVAEFDGFWDAGPNSKVSRYRWVED